MKIGIIGGGQLGKMMILEAKKLGFYIVTLDPTLHCPSHSISDEHIVAKFDDIHAIGRLAEKTDVVTYEFEHISADALTALENKGVAVYPTATSLKIIQNKFSQKELLEKKHIPVAKFMPILKPDDLKKAAGQWGYPFLLKTCIGGYDGKGNYQIHTAEDLLAAYKTLGNGTIPLMAEEYVPFEMEVSVLCCRSIQGATSIFPIGKNIHEDNILIETQVPAALSKETIQKVNAIAEDVLQAFQGVGMFCVELFITKEHAVLVNEVAPRPHNSGHYTIEGCVTSQFEQHIRAVTGLPLGATTLLRPTVMRNLLGGNPNGKTIVEGLAQALSYPEVKVHIYGKEHSAFKRKMGHLTVTANTLEEAAAIAQEAHAAITIKGCEPK